MYQCTDLEEPAVAFAAVLEEPLAAFSGILEGPAAALPVVFEAPDGGKDRAPAPESPVRRGRRSISGDLPELNVTGRTSATRV